MSRLVLRGQDAEMLPLLMRLRLSGEHEIVGMIPLGESRDLELYSEISGIPLLHESEWSTWKGSMDFLVSEIPLSHDMSELPHMSPQQCEKEYLAAEPEVSIDSMPTYDADREDHTPITEPDLRMDFPGFAHELRREIRRSRRYHLGFCFSLFRIVNARGDVLAVDRYLREPLSFLPARVGRKTDSWGVSPESILLHLAPEIQEQSRLLKRRLSSAIEKQIEDMPGGPWRCQSAQALYPQDGERASELIRHAMEALARQS